MPSKMTKSSKTTKIKTTKRSATPASEASEAEQAVLRVIYTNLHAERGNHMNRANQLKFLEAMLKQADFRDETAGNSKSWTSEELRDLLKGQLSSRKNPRHDHYDLWRGGPCLIFSPRYLRSIGIDIEELRKVPRRPGPSASTPELAPATSMEPTSPRSVISNAHPEPVQTSPKVTAPLVPASPEAPSVEGFTPPPPSAGLKRLRSEIADSEDEAPRPNKRLRADSAVSGSDSTLSADDSERSIDTEQSENVVGIKKLTRGDRLRQSARRPSMGDLYAGRYQAPLRDVQAQHADEVNAGRRPRDLLPPNLPHPSKVQDGRARDAYDLNHRIVAEKMQQLADDVISCPRRFRKPLPEIAKLVETPEPQLAKLYERVFNSNEWYSTFVKRKAQINPWELSAQSVLASIIAAELHEKVFCAEQPWSLLKIKSHPGFKYLEQVHDNVGFHSDQLLKAAQFDMISNKDFQEHTIGPHARKLAARLCDELLPHLELIADPETDGDAVTFIKKLEQIFQDAFVLKGLLDGYWEVSYEFFWPRSGDKLDLYSTEPISRQIHTPQIIMLTLFPALHITVDRTLAETSTTHCAFRARVTSRTVDA